MSYQQIAQQWLHTSVDDVRSSLRCAEANGGIPYGSDTFYALCYARGLAVQQGQKSKQKLFEQFLDRIEVKP